MYRLPNSQAGLSVQFSPLQDKLLAVGTGDNFGIVGQGTTTVLEYREAENQLVPVHSVGQPNAVFDVAFSETQPQLIYSALGNGSIAMDDLSTGQKVVYQVHEKEVNSLVISPHNPGLALSSSNDRTLKLLDLPRLGPALPNNPGIKSVFPQHQSPVHQAAWHPTTDSLFASAGQDSFLRLFELRDPRQNIVSIRAHEGEVMSCDFNKYKEEVVTSGVDRSIRIWDLRSLKAPLSILQGHRYPVRRVKCSPHHENILMSGSLDMTVKIFDTQDMANPNKFIHQNHSEFVQDIDFNMFHEQRVGSTSYDGTVRVYNWHQPQP